MSPSQDPQISHDAEVVSPQEKHSDMNAHVSQGDSTPWLGPFRFRVDYEGFKDIYHAEDDGSTRKIGFVLVVFGFAYAYVCSGILVDHLRSADLGSLGFMGVLSCLGLIGLWLYGVWCLVRPPLTTAKAQAVRFFRYHGRRVAKREIVEYESAVLSMSLGPLGGEEVTDDGGLIRSAYAFMRRPVVARGFLYAGMHDVRRDSLVWEIFSSMAKSPRPNWDCTGVFIPVSCLGGRLRAWRACFRLAWRIKLARRRYRHAVWWRRIGHIWPFARRRARALMAPELAWLQELGPEGRRGPEPERDGDDKPARIGHSSVALRGAKAFHTAQASSSGGSGYSHAAAGER
ncbi:hypothetical protein [Bifidobacterium sp. ESL0790]|uniref:hypothetical protein n=1 Tax=Bifidobacterium sp. ESL0790 TaxID=2983233 RepID=UPI0023FA452E|nr:hypothetical protein [Bifidobacterium sp. ESL0790]WEV72826.1 hypothetical protein OZY47_02325 [Bifidobacterium sp. ESL0790]